MSKKIIIYFFSMLLIASANAQDKIITRDSKVIDCIVEKVGLETISYKSNDNLGGPTYEISRNDVNSILYKNGKVDTFEHSTEESNNNDNNLVHCITLAGKPYVFGRWDDFCFSLARDTSFHIWELSVKEIGEIYENGKLRQKFFFYLADKVSKSWYAHVGYYRKHRHTKSPQDTTSEYYYDENYLNYEKRYYNKFVKWVNWAPLDKELKESVYEKLTWCKEAIDEKK